MLQNANDANAKAVEIHFDSAKGSGGAGGGALSSSAATSPLVDRITIKNDGRPFSGKDWGRLRKIAEGNPDEQKVGFFGVGFYSLFSICEEPLVLSDGACLAFYWNGDQLYARFGEAPSSAAPPRASNATAASPKDSSPWTTMYLRLRTAQEPPEWDAFAHFIAKAILFTEHLEGVSVFLNESLQFAIRKERSLARDLEISPSSVASTSTGLFTIAKARMQKITLCLDKRYVSEASSGAESSSIFASVWAMARQLTRSKAEEMDEKAARSAGSFSLALRIVSCSVRVSPSSSLASNMERITKKRPPSTTSVSFIYDSFDDSAPGQPTGKSSSPPTLAEGTKASSSAAKHPVLSGVIPDALDSKGSGRIFIGFETHQSTGLAMHIAGPFIPTVERESLDFVDPTLAHWNGDLLCVSGRMARVLYEMEMAAIAKLYNRDPVGRRGAASPSAESGMSPAYYARSGSVLEAFGVRDSTPSPIPAHLIRKEFFTCSSKSLCLPSTAGIVRLERLKSIPASIQPFSHTIPTLDVARFSNGASEIISTALRSHQIPMATISDVIEAIGTEELPIEALVAFLDWIIVSSDDHHHHIAPSNAQALRALIGGVRIPAGCHGRDGEMAYLSFSKVHFFAPEDICRAVELPIMPSCMCPLLSRRMPSSRLSSSLGLRQLSLADWASFIVGQKGVLASAGACESFLAILCMNCPIDSEEMALIASTLGAIPVVPTRMGLKRPGDSYMEGVKIFGNLATVKFSRRKDISDAFLIALGIQSHIDVGIIFAKLDSLDWDHRQLIKYLVTVQNELSDSEIATLQQARAFPSVDGGDRQKFTVGELYVDSPVVRTLLLPVLNWKNGTSPPPSSSSLDFLLSLGLQPVAPLGVLLERCAAAACSDGERTVLLRYFVDNFEKFYSRQYDPKTVQASFIPVTVLRGKSPQGSLVPLLDGSRSACLAKPLECYSDEGMELLGLPVVHRELRPYASLFGVRHRATSDHMASLLARHAFEPSHADALFSYLSTIVDDFTPDQLHRLHDADFVPLPRKKEDDSALPGGACTWRQPSDLYFSHGRYDFGQAFTVIEASHSARTFLRACGVSDEPRPVQVASRLASDAPELLARLGAQVYLDILCWLALQFDQIRKESRQVVQLLSTQPCLLAIHYEPSAPADGSEDAADDGGMTFVLASAPAIYIVDDTISQQIFNCLSAPSDAIVEALYVKLGVAHLSKCVSMTYQHSQPTRSSPAAQGLAELISKRAPLLISRRSGHSNASAPGAATALKDSKSSNAAGQRKVLRALEGLIVHEVDSIAIRRTFGGKTHDQVTTCMQGGRDASSGKGTTILVRAEYDFFDVATVVNGLVCAGESCHLSDVLLISTLLSSPLASLRAKGFPVDSILNVAPSSAARGAKLVASPVSRPKVTEAKSSDRQLPLEDAKESADAPLTSGSQQMIEQMRRLGRSSSSSDARLGQPPSPTGSFGVLGAAAEAIRGQLAKISEGATSIFGNRLGSGSSMQSALQASISSLRIHAESSVECREERMRPTLGPRKGASEEDSFCDVMPRQSLAYACAVSGLQFYVAKSLGVDAVRRLLEDKEGEMALLDAFSGLICAVASVFQMDSRTCHLYYDWDSRVIAFNRGHTLFFNFAHFKRQSCSSPPLVGQRLLASWYMVFCHELAHNFVGPHDVRHEYYMSAYAEEYFEAFLCLCTSQ